jgi:hypothetical protein
MVYKLLNFTLNGIITRFSFIVINLLTFIFTIYCMIYLSGFVKIYDKGMNPDAIDQMSDTLNSVAGVLVALGVLMECRMTIQKMTKKKIKDVHIEEYLNEVAEHNGIGLLLLGLFMEIVTLMIYVPNKLIDTSGIELYLFYSCFFFLIVSMLVEIDLMKDYFKTYFWK